eukprot:jgi/Tetstr1/429332/TSEL_019250.t1
MPASLPDCRQTCEGIVYVLRPQFMPGKPTPEQVRKVEERFACWRSIRNVGGAVDGTHVPWQPDCEHYMEDFHNYKGWYSILVVAMFVVAEVGRPGRMSDSTATQLSSFYQGMFEDKEGWLGPDSLLISDGACCLATPDLIPSTPTATTLVFPPLSPLTASEGGSRSRPY